MEYECSKDGLIAQPACIGNAGKVDRVRDINNTIIPLSPIRLSRGQVLGVERRTLSGRVLVSLTMFSWNLY